MRFLPPQRVRNFLLSQHKKSVRRNPFYSRLTCEPLEQRALLSGMAPFDLASMPLADVGSPAIQICVESADAIHSSSDQTGWLYVYLESTENPQPKLKSFDLRFNLDDTPGIAFTDAQQPSGTGIRNYLLPNGTSYTVTQESPTQITVSDLVFQYGNDIVDGRAFVQFQYVITGDTPIGTHAGISVDTDYTELFAADGQYASHALLYSTSSGAIDVVDEPGVTVMPTSGLTTTEAGGTATFTVHLDTRPTADVFINLSSSDTSEGTVSPAALIFTADNWSTPQTVTVTGVDDHGKDGSVQYTILTAAVSDDAGYNSLSVSDVSVTNADNDVVGITVTPTSGLTTMETGGTATFTIHLDTQPTANVFVNLVSNDASEGTVSPAALTFTVDDWATPQTVTVTGQDDHRFDGNVAYKIQTAGVTSMDANYNNLRVSDVSVTNTDNDIVGITITPTSGLTTTETGGTATFNIHLDTQPTANVLIHLSSSDTSEGNVSPAAVTFTADNWATPQTVTITGVDDHVKDGSVQYTILTVAESEDANYNSLNATDVLVVNNDDDVQSLIISFSDIIIPEGGSSQFTVKLQTQPTSNVTVSVVKQSGGDVDLNIIGSTDLTFTPTDWNSSQTVTIFAARDSDAIDGAARFFISSPNLVSQTVVVAEQDEDVRIYGATYDTIGLFSPSTSVCYLRNTNDAGFANETFQYGPANAGWKPVVGDWNEDGIDTMGLYNSITSIFYLRDINDAGYANQKFAYGSANADWVPIAGDWNGDGQDTIGLYSPTTSVFYLRNTNSAGFANLTFQYGPANAGWLPIVGDWNHDGRDTIGLYNPNTAMFYLRNTNDAGYANQMFSYGPTGVNWKPIVGDWNADGTDTIGLYNPATSVFYLRDANDAGYANQKFVYGPANAGWVPIAGDWSTIASGLRVAGGAVVSNTAPLCDLALQPLVTEAIVRWAAAGLSTSALAILNHASYIIADLPGSYLGWTDADIIALDRDAAGHGWFIDQTPGDDLEYSTSLTPDGSDNPTVNRADLLTVVMHEMGHRLGYDHMEDGLMSASLPVGVRRAAVDQAVSVW